MQLPKCLGLSSIAIVLTLTVAATRANAATVWSLGTSDDSQEEFAGENNASNAEPGSPTALDDDYYFTGDFDAGNVAADEPLTNFERAITDGDPTNRIHWDQATAEDLFVLTLDVCCSGNLTDGFAPFTVSINGAAVATFTATSDTDAVMTAAFDAGTGENVITLDLPEVSGGWIQFDSLELSSVPDTDGDNLSDDWENATAGNLTDLSPGNDFDADGLDDENEFTIGSDPTDDDSDDDGLLDGVETNTRIFVDGGDTGTSPIAADTDGGGVPDNVEIANDTNPNQPGDDFNFTNLWALGVDDGSQGEFSCENGGPNDAPGLAGDGTTENVGGDCGDVAITRDDDHYFAGDYDSIGPVNADEPPKEFERAIVAADPTNRIHFQLDSIPSGALILTVDTTLSGGFSNGIGRFTADINGTPVVSGVVTDQGSIHSGLVDPGILQNTADNPNENVVTITRVDAETDGGFIQFDQIRFESGDDTDEDGLPDTWELSLASDLTVLSGGDSDSDNLSDAGEFNRGTDPTDDDTDDDGLLDGVETNTGVLAGPDDRGTNPLSDDTDGDGLLDGDEFLVSTNPLDPDSDDDGLLDGVETNTGVFVSTDDTGSDPNKTDTDDGGSDDFTEVTVDNTDPNNPLDDLIFDRIMRIGLEDANQAEFSLENGTFDEAPGDPNGLDDHYYTAGVYPDPIGEVLPLDPLPEGHLVTDIRPGEPLLNLERAVTGFADNTVVIHFILDETPPPLTRYKVVAPSVFNDAGNDIPLSIKLNGREMLCPTPETCPTSGNQETVLFITPAITAIQAGAQEGENIIEFSTENTAGGWIQFDYIDLLAGPPDAADSADGDNLLDVWELSWDGISNISQLSDAGDFDSDLLTDLEEFVLGTDPTDDDSDDDGLEDGAEVNTHGTDPLDADSDNDGLEDGLEINTTGSDPLLADTDGDGLSDGDEVNGNPATNPTLADSDSDTFSDRDEIRGGSDPNSDGSVPPDFISIWTIGTDDESTDEFSEENHASNDPPGDPAALDDDFYFAGFYDTVGEVSVDEPATNFERGLGGDDPIDRIHFINEEEFEDNTVFRLTWDFIENNSVPHPFEVSLNGVQVFNGVVDDAVENKFFVIFTAAPAAGGGAAGLVGGLPVGENVVTFTRGDVSTGGWIIFDHVTLEFAESGPPPMGPRFRRGDHDGSGLVDITDPLNLLSFLFLGQTPPICQDASDGDNSAALDISDALNVLGFLFLGSFPLNDTPPGPNTCGLDPNMPVDPDGPGGFPEQPATSLGCDMYPSAVGTACP
jgi:hypothetical protein